MKLRESQASTVHRVGIESGSRRAFGMRAGKKAFKILSSTIYKYKIRAIIREISCNAIDGHIVAGNMDRFDVQLPTVLDPRFIVRDYGTGLSDYMVNEVFTVYFESTKTDTDDLIGALGLGSKSPFCYTSTFTVESIQDGMKRGYTAYLNEDGEPYIDPLYAVETDEPNGVQVTVPVNVEDIPEWEREAARVYEAFTTIRPRFIGVQLDINWQPTEANNRGIIRYKSKHYSGLFARMGNICYPIDLDMFRDSLFYCYQNSDYAYILDFPLGTLDFMPSREELSLDKITKQAILDRLKGINECYYSELTEDFAKLKTTREKVIWYQNLPTMLQSFVTRDKKFRVGNITLSDLVMHFNSKDLITNMQIWGYWANTYDGKDCSFERTGSGRRWETFKSETMRRQDITRMLHPWKQRNLYLLQNDNNAKSVRAYAIGYCMLHKTDRMNFVEYDPNRNQDNLQNFIKNGYYDESEIVYLKTSEMTEELEVYTEGRRRWRATRETIDKDSEPRPKTPTAYRYTVGINGDLNKEDLFLTKAEFVNLESAYALRLYGVDDYSSLSESNNFSMSSIMNNLATVMEISGVRVVYTLRNSLWNKIPDSSMICLDTFLAELFCKTAKEMKPNWYPAFVSKKYRGSVKELYENLGISLDRMVKNRYDSRRYNILNTLDGNVLMQTTEDGETTEAKNPSIRVAQARHEEMEHAMIERVDEQYEIFAKRNPLIARILRNSDGYQIRYILGDKAMTDDMVKLIRWK
ncbi:protector from prophage-induced early lysis [Escherichia phage Lw1]|uniref:Protector from prophage-induced early lysis n=1 Tax=Escherichia phage Lw1 TaxID=1307804 RepID=M9UX93_9CAUD|nr:RIIA lysis inhibitor [Escherichia phage Lw1]AGJ71410.1 protector from prophage-induced early lysis [Escherichia phage Lw1]